ncbi:MAG: carboxypeptidase-like regulatory domain-containing protein [bacterium]
MRKDFTRIFIIFLTVLTLETNNISFAETLNGAVNENQIIEIGKSFKVVDSKTGRPISNANVTIPSMGLSTKTDSQGYFSIKANLNGPAILGISADGYNPFSLTVEKDNLNKPFTVGLSKTSSNVLVVDETLRHLGDNNFSPSSANAEEFQISAGGSTFNKRFYVGDVPADQKASLKIGSIIGLDTLISRKLSHIKINSYSTPSTIYLNSKKIGELRINGDNQVISFPAALLIPNSLNELSVQTGHNEVSNYLDYDDMEFMNITIAFK